MKLEAISVRETDWLASALNALSRKGCAVVTGVLDDELLEATRRAVYRARDGVVAEIGSERLARAGEIGTIRLPMRFDDTFYRLLDVAPMLDVVDAMLGDAAILHLQNAFALPSFESNAAPVVFQNTFHRDFPRFTNGYVHSINAFFAIDAFTEANGATLVVPGSHQQAAVPDADEMLAAAVPAVAPAGAMLLFDSTLWHAAGRNVSGRDRLAVNQQFTRSYVKQQIDYVRALGDDAVLDQKPRIQQLLGWYTRVVTSLDEYYRPEHERLYRRNQG